MKQYKIIYIQSHSNIYNLPQKRPPKTQMPFHEYFPRNPCHVWPPTVLGVDTVKKLRGTPLASTLAWKASDTLLGRGVLLSGN